MQSNYQAQWMSRRRMHELKKAGSPEKTLYLNHLKGVIVVEPMGCGLGDGDLLSPQEVEYELQPAWVLEPTATLRDARQRLGLDPVSVGA